MILEFLKKYEKESILISALLIIVAMFLIAKPGMALSTAVTLFAIVFLVDGIINIITYIMEDAEIRAFSTELIMGILLVILGIIILLNQPLFISILPIMIGLWIFIRSIIKFQLAINLKSTIADKWGALLVSSILMGILGVLIIVNPFEAILTLTRFIGIMMLVIEIVNICESVYFLVKTKNNFYHKEISHLKTIH